MDEKNAINFLLYSYLGITLESKEEDYEKDCKKYDIIQDKIIYGAINRAYRDAASHVLSIQGEDKDEIKIAATKWIKEQIENWVPMSVITNGIKTVVELCVFFLRTSVKRELKELLHME